MKQVPPEAKAARSCRRGKGRDKGPDGFPRPRGLRCPATRPSRPIFQYLKLAVFLGFAWLLNGCQTASRPQATNIIFILADDLGYGDVQALTPSSKIPTPTLNKLAAEGLSFTNAHAAAAVCTPSRYSFLTGNYSWRSGRKQGVIWVWESPLIPPDCLTVGEMLKQQGYDTACVGKWHLGMDWPTRDGRPATLENLGTNVDYDAPIRNGPVDRGFDYYFGQEVPGFPPHTFIENNRVATKPTAWRNAGISGLPGAMAPGWRYEDEMYKLTDKAMEYIRQQASKKTGRPFFLYFSMSAPHTPIAPHENFQGKTDVGRYGDFVYEMDFHVGQVLDLLDHLGLAKNTLVIFSSDNGPVNEDGLKYDSAVGELVKNYRHNSSGPLRGMKSDAWEGGHRVPFIVKWPGHVPPHSTSGALISQVDMMATFAALSGARLPGDAAVDSVDMLPVLEGKTKSGRKALVAQSGEGVLSIQEGDWKLVTCSGGGGMWNPVGQPARVRFEGEHAVWENVQLYNTVNDLAETNNLAARNPEKVQELMKLLKKYIQEGRSTPGTALPLGPVQPWPEVPWFDEVR